VDLLKQLEDEFGEHASFLFVYIAEAHATDEWPIGDNLVTGRTVNQPTTLSQRHVEALHFAEKFKTSWPVAVDSPELGDPFLKAYAPWPTRFYIVKDGKMFFIAYPNREHSFDLDPLRESLWNAVYGHN
jgi:hypothetical protein